MPSTIATRSELDRRLDAAIDEVQRASARHPRAAELGEIGAQLARLRAALRGGEELQALRDSLDFGQIASRHVDPIEPALARELCEIASWIAYA